jgi:single-strand DNA-binding protein
MYNRTTLVGRLANDPQLKYTPSGVAVSTFRLAVNRPVPNKDGQREADFLDVVAWRQQAEFAANYLGKGRLVLVEGRIQVRSYDAQDGQRRKVWEIVSENLRGLDRPKDPGTAESTNAAPAEGGATAFDDPFQEE